MYEATQFLCSSLGSETRRHTRNATAGDERTDVDRVVVNIFVEVSESFSSLLNIVSKISHSLPPDMK